MSAKNPVLHLSAGTVDLCRESCMAVLQYQSSYLERHITEIGLFGCLQYCEAINDIMYLMQFIDTDEHDKTHMELLEKFWKRMNEIVEEEDEE